MPGHESENDRLRDFVTELADRVGLDEDDRQALDITASIVGVGRLPVFDILEKKGALSPEELARVRDIPKIWAEFTAQLGFLQILGVPQIVESYCESWDGSGYPRGLAGEEIPLCARILAVCYHYNGMISDRPYRKAFPHGRAADEIRRMSGRMLDPTLVETFIEMVEEKRKTARLVAKAKVARLSPTHQSRSGDGAKSPKSERRPASAQEVKKKVERKAASSGQRRRPDRAAKKTKKKAARLKSPSSDRAAKKTMKKAARVKSPSSDRAAKKTKKKAARVKSPSSGRAAKKMKKKAAQVSSPKSVKKAAKKAKKAKKTKRAKKTKKAKKAKKTRTRAKRKTR